ncbi:MAG: hypothetical protein WBQ86_04560 [Candidatus Binatus sp.]|jgi:hypothetical protein
MARDKYWIYREPAEKDYTQLIELCAKRCPKCTFVMEYPQQFGKNCHQFLASQKEHLIEVADQMEWPGTRLMGHSARVHWYRVTPKLIATLKAKVRGLYEWVLPDLPEDLGFYWPDGSPLLGTSSHEQFAFVNLSEQEFDEFSEEVPDLRLNKLRPPRVDW